MSDDFTLDGDYLTPAERAEREAERRRRKIEEAKSRIEPKRQGVLFPGSHSCKPGQLDLSFGD